jgi:hypothetical protein
MAARPLGIIGVSLTVALVAVLPLVSSAEAARSSFSGSCQLTGEVSFTPPLTLHSQQTQADATAGGACTGTWRRGRQVFRLDQAHVDYRATSSGLQSCSEGEALGTGFLRYRKDKLRFELAEERLGTSVSMRMEGRYGGLFEGTATAEGNPVGLVLSCLTTEISRVEIAIEGLATDWLSG